MSCLSAADRERLCKLCGLLTSNHDGERAAAGRKASEFLRERGLTWSDALVAIAPPPLRMPAPASYAVWPGSDARMIASRLLRTPGALSGWEHDFLVSVVNQRRLSPRQQQKVREVWDRVQARGSR